MVVLASSAPSWKLRLQPGPASKLTLCRPPLHRLVEMSGPAHPLGRLLRLGTLRLVHLPGPGCCCAGLVCVRIHTHTHTLTHSLTHSHLHELVMCVRCFFFGAASTRTLFLFLCLLRPPRAAHLFRLLSFSSNCLALLRLVSTFFVHSAASLAFSLIPACFLRECLL